MFTWSSSPHRCCSRSARPLVLCSPWSAPGSGAGRHTGSPVTPRLGNSNTLVSYKPLKKTYFVWSEPNKTKSKRWRNMWSVWTSRVESVLSRTEDLHISRRVWCYNDPPRLGSKGRLVKVLRNLNTKECICVLSHYLKFIHSLLLYVLLNMFFTLCYVFPKIINSQHYANLKKLQFVLHISWKCILSYHLFSSCSLKILLRLCSLSILCISKTFSILLIMFPKNMNC